jgi:translocator protein
VAFARAGINKCTRIFLYRKDLIMDSIFFPRSKPVEIISRPVHSKPGWGVLAAIVFVTALAAIAGSIASVNAPEFYQQLSRPSWAPPAWLFGPVWTVLFIMMAVAAWLVVRVKGVYAAKPELALYISQLGFNALWSWLFFYGHMGAAAFFEALILVLFVALTARAFWRVRTSAGALLLPYLAWVSFASALTFAIWQRNPSLL